MLPLLLVINLVSHRGRELSDRGRVFSFLTLCVRVRLMLFRS